MKHHHQHRTGRHIHYVSRDGLVRIETTDYDSRYPRGSYRTTIARLTPTEHTRVRFFRGTVEWMPTGSDLTGLIAALRSCKPDLDPLLTGLKDKPESRKAAWRQWNQQRVRRHR